MDSDQVPWISPELLAHLDRYFPDRAPEPLALIQTIRHNAGQVSVVRHLKYLAKRQVERALLGEESE